MENRPLLDFKRGRVRPVELGSQNVRGQQIRGELDALKGGLNGGGQGFHRRGFGQARKAFQQQVPIAQKADDQPFNEIPLAHDHLFHIGHDLPDHNAFLLHRSGDFLNIH